MKTILVLSVLFLAAQCNPDALIQFYQGFINTLPMEPQLKNQVFNNGLVCLNSSIGVLQESLWVIERSFRTHDFGGLARFLLSAEELLQHKVAPQCLSAYEQIVSFFIKNKKALYNNTAPYDEDYNSQFMFTRAEILQAAGQTIERILYLQMNAAGEKFARFLMLCNGMVSPAIPTDLLPYEYNSNYTYRPHEEIFSEVMTGFFKEFGTVDPQELNNSLACAHDLSKTFERALNNPYLTRGDALSKTGAIIEVVFGLGDALQRCHSLHNVHFVTIRRIAEIFKRYPIQFIIQTHLNYLTENPDIIKLAFNADRLRSKGLNELQGRNLALVYKALLKNIPY